MIMGLYDQFSDHLLVDMIAQGFAYCDTSYGMHVSLDRLHTALAAYPCTTRKRRNDVSK